MKAFILYAILLIMHTFHADAQYLLVRHPHNRDATRHNFNGCKHFITANAASGSVGGNLSGTMGLEYEQFLGKKRLVSTTLKASVFGDAWLLDNSQENITSRNSGYFIAPGIHLHLLGRANNIDLNLGLSAAMGRAKRSDEYIDTHGVNRYGGDVNHFFGAAIGELTASFLSPRHRFFFSLYLSGGYIYARPESRYYRSLGVDAESASTKPGWAMFGIRLGGRW